MNVSNDWFGYSSDHEMRTKLAEAAVIYLNPDDRFAANHRAPLNGFIMSVQEPYLEIIHKLQEQLSYANRSLQETVASMKEQKKRYHDKARDDRAKVKDV